MRRHDMPKLTVDGVAEFEVPQGKRLVNALSDEAQIDQLHACGGNARGTTLRVQFVAGEPERMTQAEKELLELRGLSGTAGLRLSCQILCDHDMEVKAISRFEGSGRKDAGKHPEDSITPPAVLTTRNGESLERSGLIAPATLADAPADPSRNGHG